MSKISELSDGGVIQGGDTLIAVRSGGNVKVTYGGSTTANIDGGTIDGTVIGGTTPAAVTTSSLVATTADINAGTIDGTVIGGTTPAAGTFTTGQFNTSLNVAGSDAALAASIGTDAQRVYITPNGTVINYNASGDSAGSHLFQTGNVNRLNIASNGDISFYEDTGTTAKFFWDASAESLDISGNVSFNSDNLTGTALQIGGESGSGIKTRYVFSGASQHNWQLGFAAHASQTFSITPSSAVGNTTFTTPAFNIDGSSGNVGIGTTTPAAPLSFGSITNDARIYLRGNTNEFAIGTNGLQTVYAGYQGHVFETGSFGGAEAMRIDSSGNLLVGTTVLPATMLTDGYSGFVVDGANDYIVSSRFNDIAAYFKRENSDGSVVAFYRDGTSVGTISVTTSATTYLTSSDQRLKENIADADDAGSKIDAIKVRQYDWKVDGSHQDYGMVAQELMTVAPEAVSGDPESDEMMGVDYSKLVPMLIKEVQSLRARVAQLEGAN